jgi:hypothetical protein
MLQRIENISAKLGLYSFYISLATLLSNIFILGEISIYIPVITLTISILLIGLSLSTFYWQIRR